MEHSTQSPKPVYVYPLPAKTQGEHGNSKAYRISLGILWVCFLLPVIGVVFGLEKLLLSYYSTNIFITFFIVYFGFYKNPVFLCLILLTLAFFLPVLRIAASIEQYLPSFMYALKGEVTPLIALDVISGGIFFVIFYIMDYVIEILFKIRFKNFILPFILCATSSFYFYFFSLYISAVLYDSIR